MTVVTLGETMAVFAPDHIGPLRHTRTMSLSIAGSESTVAIGLSRLGRTAVWIGRVGADELGTLVESRLRGEGVEVHAVRDEDAPTGLMIKERRAAGARGVLYYRSGSAGSRLSVVDVPDGLIESAELVHVTGITCAISESAAGTVRASIAAARACDVVVSLDVNHRRRLWTDAEMVRTIGSLLSEVDVLFASEDEARLLEPEGLDHADLARRLAERGPATVVLTLGAGGAVSFTAHGILPVPAVAVEEVDPVGAGDAFVAGYLAGLLRGDSEADRLRRACAVAALSVSTQGDWEGLPTEAELGIAGRSGDQITR